MSPMMAEGLAKKLDRLIELQERTVQLLEMRQSPSIVWPVVQSGPVAVSLIEEASVASVTVSSDAVDTYCKIEEARENKPDVASALVPVQPTPPPPPAKSMIDRLKEKKANRR